MIVPNKDVIMHVCISRNNMFYFVGSVGELREVKKLDQKIGFYKRIKIYSILSEFL